MKLAKRNLSTLIIFISTLLLLTACDNTPPKEKIENPLAGQVEALKKAKELEKQLLDAAEKQREAIDKLGK